MLTALHRAAPALIITVLLGACSTAPRSGNDLYVALGEQPGIRAIVDSFLYALADNELVLPLFAHSNIERFREQFAAQLCAVAGGPCQYRGDSMQATHRGMNIDHAQFNSVVEDLLWALDANNVPVAAQNGLLARLAPMYGDIAHQ